MRFAAVINMSSGSSSDVSEQMAEIFSQHGAELGDVHIVESAQVLDCFENQSFAGHDGLVTFGGDGTSNLGAQTAMARNMVFIPLPGGTMNMLPKALYKSTDWAACLDMALSQAGPRDLPFGQIGDHVFLVAAIIGDSAKMQKSRELARDGKLTQGLSELTESLTAAGAVSDITLWLGDKEEQHAAVAMVTCPFMNQGASRADKFETVSVDRLDTLDWVELGWKSLISDWREAQAITTEFSSTVAFDGKGEVPVLCDGERFTMRYPFTAKLRKGALNVLAPEHRSDEPAA